MSEAIKWMAVVLIPCYVWYQKSESSNLCHYIYYSNYDIAPNSRVETVPICSYSIILYCSLRQHHFDIIAYLGSSLLNHSLLFLFYAPFLFYLGSRLLNHLISVIMPLFINEQLKKSLFSLSFAFQHG